MSSSGDLHLLGSAVALEPLSFDHVEALTVAATEDRSTFALTPVPDTVASMHAYVDALLASARANQVVPFAQRRLADGAIVGCTRLLEMRRWSGRDDPDEVEIGGTWLAGSAQRSAVNTEAKLLLCTHVFETWGVGRLAICTDARNTRSRDAITRLGATFEGILRNHRASAVAGEIGRARDTAMYSILDSEWPQVKQAMTARLSSRGRG